MYIIVLFCAFLFAQAERNWPNVEERKLTVDVRLFPVAPPTALLISQKVNEKDNRIVNGEEAQPHQFPHQAGLLLTLQDGQQAFCGGSLISENFVLTAAHCVDGMKNIEVILGAHKIREQEDTQIRMNTTKFIVHEEWSLQWMRNDIALVQLPKPVQTNEYVQIIQLPAKSEDRDYMGDKATVSGWGRTSDTTTGTSPVLRYTNSKVISNKRCFLTYPFMIHASHICMDGREGKSSCNGDSGGPLIVEDEGKPSLIGLVSFGRADGCERGHPAVYTRITWFYDWIQKNVQQ